MSNKPLSHRASMRKSVQKFVRIKQALGYDVSEVLTRYVDTLEATNPEAYPSIDTANAEVEYAAYKVPASNI
jgi:hypothetical protein